MAIITLTTDCGSRDPYAAALKGFLASQAPKAQVIDITHDIQSFYVEEAAFILGHSFHFYPKGTIHIVSVDDRKEGGDKFMMMKKEDHWFIGPDNGIFSMIRPELKADELIELNFFRGESKFPALDIYVPAAAHLLRGGSSDVLGKKLVDMVETKIIRPTLSPGNTAITGMVQHIDVYGNLISNIPGTWITEHQAGRNITIDLGRKYNVNKLSNHYHDVSEGQLLGLINSMGYLEIAINRQAGPANNGASQLLGLYLRDRIEVVFS